MTYSIQLGNSCRKQMATDDGKHQCRAFHQHCLQHRSGGYLYVRCSERPVMPSCVCPRRDTSNTEEHSSTLAVGTWSSTALTASSRICQAETKQHRQHAQ